MGIDDRSPAAAFGQSQSRQLKQKPEFLCIAALHLVAMFGQSH